MTTISYHVFLNLDISFFGVFSSFLQSFLQNFVAGKKKPCLTKPLILHLIPFFSHCPRGQTCLSSWWQDSDHVGNLGGGYWTKSKQIFSIFSISPFQNKSHVTPRRLSPWFYFWILRGVSWGRAGCLATWAIYGVVESPRGRAGRGSETGSRKPILFHWFINLMCCHGDMN